MTRNIQVQAIIWTNADLNIILAPAENFNWEHCFVIGVYKLYLFLSDTETEKSIIQLICKIL